ncbi:MAG: hypothetical protein JWN89_4 [Parcubacteria group bacterium]|nr:hypothetical protein [Parcubacteria group bacterium]
MITAHFLANLLAVVVYFLFWSEVFIILYHLTRFGIGTQPKRYAAVFFLGSIILFLVSVVAYFTLDFSTLSHLIKLS